MKCVSPFTAWCLIKHKGEFLLSQRIMFRSVREPRTVSSHPADIVAFPSRVRKRAHFLLRLTNFCFLFGAALRGAFAAPPGPAMASACTRNVPLTDCVFCPHTQTTVLSHSKQRLLHGPHGIFVSEGSFPYLCNREVLRPAIRKHQFSWTSSVLKQMLRWLPNYAAHRWLLGPFLEPLPF